MEDLPTEAQLALMATLGVRGLATSAELQAALGKSQPTVSRLLADLAPRVVALGRGRRARYALPRDILGLSGSQPLHWVDEAGHVRPWGRLTFLAGDRLHIEADGIDLVTRGGLPWFLAPLRSEGFLGRLLARRLALHGVDGNPERWPLEHVLFAALQTHDAPGALQLGEPGPAAGSPPAARADPAQRYDELAEAVARSLPAGSSAGGEQAKFLARLSSGEHVIVKFSPPRGTPFGERWHDLLHAEHLALTVLAAHGVPVARSRVVESGSRTFLESERFDRVGAAGRRHAVPLHAVHDAFVPGARVHWGETCAALARQRRVPPQVPAQVDALLRFGRLIGNSDMHFGNLSLLVERDAVRQGRFTLAPLYDMLPMRWRPNVLSGDLALLPFEPSPLDRQSASSTLAREFWQRAHALGALSRPFRALAGTMAQRLGG